MKLTLSKTTLEKAAKLLSKVINTSNVIPILDDILCSIERQDLTLTASDSFMTMSTTLALDSSEGEGKFCVNAKQLLAALTNLIDQPITIETDDTTFALLHETGEYNFPIESADDYPLHDQEEFKSDFIIKGDVVRDAIKRSIWATAKDDLRPAMTGISFQLGSEGMVIAASDGHVLVKTAYSFDGEVYAGKPESLIIPRKVAQILQQELSEDIIKILWNKDHARVEFSDYALQFSLVDAKYPDINKVIPSETAFNAAIPRMSFISSVSKVIPFSDFADGSSNRKVLLHFEMNTLKVQGANINFNTSAKDKMDISYVHEPLSVGMNGQMLIALLKELCGLDVEMGMNGPDKSVTFRPTENPDNTEITMLMMPMIISEE